MKRIIALLLAVLMLFAMAACTKDEKKEETDSQGIAAEATVYPVTLVDQAGREVVIESAPQKIVSGYYISTSAVIALELDGKMVGIEAKADKRAIYKLSAPELIELPSVGSAKEFDLEGCAALEPDLVILPLKLKDAAATLESLGIDVLLVNPENQELLTEMILLIAKAADAQPRAAELLGFITEQEEMLSKKLKNEEAPKVYLAGNSSMLSTAGNAMYQSAMIGQAGGVNAAAEIEDSYWVEISYEQLLTWNPDYIILASDASYTAEDVLADPNLKGCEAVKNGNVYRMPDKAEAWDSPVPGGILGSLWLANVLHPEVITEEEVNTLTDEYYETFYGFTYSEN